MRTVDATEAQARLDEILEDAQRQPIVLSIAEYERFRGDAIRAFLELRNDIAAEATEAGLTEEGIAGLLSED
jgi:hypothetical protein